MDFEQMMLKSIALVVQNVEKEDDVHVYLGILQLTDGECFFVNEQEGWRVSLDSEQVNRLKLVPESLKSMLLNAEYFLPMTIQTLPGSDGYEKTGMKWHE